MSARADLIAKNAIVSGRHERTVSTGDWANLSVGERLSPASSGPRALQRSARRARGDARVVKVLTLLAVIVVTVAGVYIAWLKGAAGGGEGGIVVGGALLVAAVARLVLPSGALGLLAARSRAVDFLTLTAFGGCLLVAGLALLLQY